MLIELSVADAFGASFEFASKKFVTENNNCLNGYVENPRRKGFVGRYTDDTQMSMALIEAMLLGVPWTPKFLAAKFLEVFKRDPRSGYARRFHALLTSVKDSTELLATLNPDSDRSGAAMRATPLGLMPKIEMVMRYSEIQAAITHNTDAGRNAAIASSLMTHYFAYNYGPKKNLGSFLSEMVDGPWAIPYEGSVGNIGWQCVQAAVTAIVANNKMTDILKASIDFTGDVDTVACIAIAASSFSSEIEYDLPQSLFDGLENGLYGRDYMRALDFQLMSKFGFSHHPKSLANDIICDKTNRY